jgi:hypothetical protein
MKQEDIIRLAREAGFADGVVDIVGAEGFANFAALVAAAEREACARVCEKMWLEWLDSPEENEPNKPDAEDCYKAIRRRA